MENPQNSPVSSNGITNIGFNKEEEEPPTLVLENEINSNSPPSEYSIDMKTMHSETVSKKFGRSAIQVEAAEKNYGKQSILQGLFMTVQEGTIYGLLGSSGCGKTTLLSCIVGLKQLDNGRISIFGKSPGTPACGIPGRLVGYMPQEVSLNEEFTMAEVCQYFGRLYGMNMDKVHDRVEYLVDLLDLRKCNGRLCNFSGGQKRRASFVVALLHEPEILILDEPTVGVDPILRAKIWKHIRELTDSFGTTVIITTHYIEEMRQAERVGIMRNGQLMAEASPANLLAYHNAEMLEDVVLKYCLQREDSDVIAQDLKRLRRNTVSFEHEYGSNRNSSVAPDIYFGNQVQNGGIIMNLPPYSRHKQNNTSQLNRIWALVRKNIIVLLRNVGFLLFLFMVPAIVIVFFSLAIGKPPNNLNLGYINEDLNHECEKMIPITCNPIELSCAYLDILQSFDALKMYKYTSVEAVLAEVEKREIWGYIHFSKNFSGHVFDRTLGKKLTNETIEGSQIRVRLDMSSISIGSAIKNLVFQGYRIFSQKLLTVCNVDITGKDLPIQFQKPIYGDENGKFTSYVVPGVVIGFLPFISCVSCALSYIIEKKDGMLDRTKVAGVTAFDIMLSHAIPQLVIIVGQTIVTFIIMYIFDIPLDIGNPFLALILTIVASITGMTMGFTAAEIFDEEKNAMLFAIATIFPSFLLSGLLWPIEGLPMFFKVFSYFLPGTMAAESLRSILFRGWSLSYFTVYIGFISQFAFIIFFISLTYVLHQIRK